MTEYIEKVRMHYLGSPDAWGGHFSSSLGCGCGGLDGGIGGGERRVGLAAADAAILLTRVVPPMDPLSAAG
jgi:hypothetical protein